MHTSRIIFMHTTHGVFIMTCGRNLLVLHTLLSVLTIGSETLPGPVLCAVIGTLLGYTMFKLENKLSLVHGSDGKFEQLANYI